MKKYAFTLVELIVVITILVILGTISLISLNNFSASARDAKRLSDVRSLYTKFTLENIKGTRYSELVKNITTSEMQINGSMVVVGQGVPNFETLKENRNNFLDPSTNADYPVAFHEAGLVASTITPPSDPSILEIATINEEKNLAVVVGNYFPREEGDTSGLIINPTTDKIITNDSGNLPYDIGDGNGENTEESAIEIYGDEGEAEIEACKEWVAQNIPSELGDWIWVPAREEYFIDDGFIGGTKITDEYYKREVIYKDVKYICKGFAVAKYEMSYNDEIEPNSVAVNTSGPNLPLLTDTNGVTYVDITSNGGITSIANRYPLTMLDQAQAIEVCNNLLIGTHLITNNEWMTIARNIENQDTNWTGESVGNGYIYTGVTGSPNYGCGVANTDIYDRSLTNQYYIGLPRPAGTKTGIGIGITDTINCDEKRQLELSNGQTIWDLSGNIGENVNKANTIDGSNFNSGQLRITGCSPEGLRQAENTPNGCWDNEGTTQDRIKYGPLTEGGYNMGLGDVTNSVGISNNVLIRGGNYQSGHRGGIYTIELAMKIRADDIKDRGSGFRCTL